MLAECKRFIPVPSEFFKLQPPSLSGASDQLWPLEGSRGTKAPRRGCWNPSETSNTEMSRNTKCRVRQKHKQEVGNSGNTYTRKFSLLIWKVEWSGCPVLDLATLTSAIAHEPHVREVALVLLRNLLEGTSWGGVRWAHRNQPWVLITQVINVLAQPVLESALQEKTVTEPGAIRVTDPSSPSPPARDVTAFATSATDGNGWRKMYDISVCGRGLSNHCVTAPGDSCTLCSPPSLILASFTSHDNQFSYSRICHFPHMFPMTLPFPKVHFLFGDLPKLCFLNVPFSN